MTLPSLLRKVGIHVPRGVTVGGALVLGTEPMRSLASVTAVEPHRFHGGEDPTPSIIDEESAWWIQSPQMKVDDIADMRKRFTNVTVLDDDQDFAYGVTFNNGIAKYDVLILPRADISLPKVRVVKPKRLGRNEGRYFRKPPHLYVSGAICVADRSDWDGKGYKTSVAAAWAAHWLACYSTWRLNGIWPTEGFEPNEV